MIVAVASRKASPGVTTLTALLAMRWREAGVARFIVEADPSGGTLAARWSDALGVSWTPGLVELATARAEGDVGVLQGLSQPVGDDVHLFAAPSGPGQVVNALTTMGDRGAAWLAGVAGAGCFVDCGRLDGRSPALPLAQRAVLTLMVCRPLLEEIYAALAGVVELSAAGCRVGLVLVGSGHWSADEIAAQVGVDVFGVVPDDPRVARLFNTRGFGAARAVAKSRLVASVDELAARVHTVAATARTPLPPPLPPPSGLPVVPPAGTPVGAAGQPSVAVETARRRAVAPRPLSDTVTGRQAGSRNGDGR